jgi:hypothetical protein
LSVRRNRFEADERRFQDQVCEDFQDQIYEDFKTMSQVPLNILHLYFSIYSIELELHDRNVGHVHLCKGLTRIDLSFLETLEVFLGGHHRLVIA